MLLDWHGRRLLVTRQGSDFAIHAADHPGLPLAAGRLDELAAPLLAGVAAALAGLR
jgi:hypothetical protein